MLAVDVRPRPDTFYGVGKVAAEALLSLYADRYGIDAVCRADRQLPAGAGDHPQPVHLALPRRRGADGRGGADHPRPGLRGALRHLREHPRAGGTSTPGRALGYHPQDDAERYVDQVTRDDRRDQVEGAHVGGSYVLEQLHRPALDGPTHPN